MMVENEEVKVEIEAIKKVADATRTLIPQRPKINYIGVLYPTTAKEYFYKCDFDVELDDIVVCDSSAGLGIAKVVNLNGNAQQATRWIVCKIDMVTHNERIKLDQKRMGLRKQMDDRRKMLEDEALYLVLAERDPKMAELIKEYYSI